MAGLLGAAVVATARAAAAALLALAAGGCSYLPQAIVGQVDVISNSVPAEDAIARASLPPQRAGQLLLIQDVLEFARARIGLTPGDSYRVVYDTGDDYPSYAVSAAHPARLEPVTWSFPIVGSVPYLGYFDEAAAVAHGERLAEAGYDVVVSPVEAYSTLGWFADPVFTGMLRRSPASLIGLILHESTHATLYAPGRTAFNENVAVFVQRQGAREYLEARGARMGLDAGELRRAERSWATTEWFNGLAGELRDELAALYEASALADLDVETVKLAREPVFTRFRLRIARRPVDRPELSSAYDAFASARATTLNNAVVMSIARYELSQSLFEDTFAATGDDWNAAFAVWREAARAADPLAHLAAWLESTRTE